jgi:hypothetical protein
MLGGRAGGNLRPELSAQTTNRLASIDAAARISLSSEGTFPRRAFMKKLAILILLALGIAALACGHNNIVDPTSTTTSGNWEARLIGGVGDASLLNFVTGFSVTNVNGGQTEPLAITSFGFINVGPCFPQLPSESGTANLTTSSENQVSGNVLYIVDSSDSQQSQLKLFTQNSNGQTVGGVSGSTNGATFTTLTNGIIWGDWTLTSNNSNCTGQGTFVMCQNSNNCTVP